VPGEITRALNDGDRARVIELSESRFRRLWTTIAEKVIPATKRRSEDGDDVVQETLMQLDRYLRGGATFGDSGDVLRWTSRVANNKALQARDRSSRYEGPSTLSSQSNPGEHQDPHDSLAIAASDATASSSTRATDIAVQIAETHKELTELVSGLHSRITSLLSDSTPVAQDILVRYFEGSGSRAVASQVSAIGRHRITEHYVRHATFVFKEHIDLQTAVMEFRERLKAIEAPVDEVIKQLTIPSCVARIVVDFRSQP
jgi:DNA-directed RNA polymerase specialized sigma24 family protein